MIVSNMALLKKVLLIVGFVGTIVPGLVFASVADDLNKQLGGAAQRAEYGEAQDPRTIAEEVIVIILELTGTIFLILMIIGGYHYFTSAGDEEKAKKGKGYIRNSVIGLTVVLSSYSITLFVVSQTQDAAFGGGNSQVPPGTPPGEIVLCCDMIWKNVMLDESSTFIVNNEQDCYSRCDGQGNNPPDSCEVSRVTKNECVTRERDWYDP